MPKQEQINLFENDPEYQEFIDKFKPKKTTDDCYTPENIYEAVAEWVEKEYRVERGKMVRPFWPGWDYQEIEYPEDCVVVDNPPFSLMTQIYSFYIARGIRFFLFAPTLTLFSNQQDICFIPCGASVTYDNGAKVNTSFATNLDACRLRTVPDLYKIIKEQNTINEKKQTASLPKYKYPAHLLTAAAASQYSHYGIDFHLEKKDCTFVRKLDMQAEYGKTIFGGGLLLSSRAAAERAAAERAAAERAAAERAATHEWKLSEREMQIVNNMGE